MDTRGDSRAGLAALTRALTELLARDAPHVRDPLDDLPDRRSAKFVH